MYGAILTLILVIMISIGRYVSKNWFNPAYILLLYWSVFIIFSLAVFQGSFSWNYFGLLWIILACTVFGVGHSLGGSFRNKITISNFDIRHTNTSFEEKLSSFSWKLILLFIVIGFSRTLYELALNGFSVQMFFDLDSLINMNTSMADERYSGSLSYGLVMQVMLIFVYVSPLCGGYAFVYASKNFERLISFLTFLPIISSVLLTNGKAGLIASVLLWITGFIISYLERYKTPPKIKVSWILKIGGGGILVGGLLYFSMLLRIGEISLTTMRIVNEKFINYAFGSLPAFDFWFGNYTLFSNHFLGTYTFMAFSDLLGIADRSQGLYTDVLVYSFGKTNVYTAFRALIIDFGLVGSLIVLAILGMFTGYAFQSLIRKHENTIFLKMFLSSVYFYILYSLLTSSWTYMSFTLPFVIFGFYLWTSNPNFRVSFNKNYPDKTNVLAGGFNNVNGN